MNTKNIALSVIILFVLVLSAALGTTATAAAGDEAKNLNLTTQQELADAEGLEGDAVWDWLLGVLTYLYNSVTDLQGEVEELKSGTIKTEVAPGIYAPLFTSCSAGGGDYHILRPYKYDDGLVWYTSWGAVNHQGKKYRQYDPTTGEWRDCLNW